MKNTYTIMLISLFGLCLFGCANAQQKQAKGETGRLAPDFTTVTLSGKAFTLKKQRGKVVFVNFFATYCPGCVKEMSHIEKELYLKYKNRADFAMISIARGQDNAIVEKFVKNKKITFPTAADPQQLVFSKYAEKMIPRNYVIGKDGKIKLISVGYTNAKFKELLKTIDQELYKN